MDRVLTFSQTEIYTQESIKMASLMEKDNTHGRMAHFTLGNLRTVLSTEKVNGNQEWDLRATNTRETIVMIRSMALAFSHGLVGIFTKANIKKTRGMDMER